MRIQICLHLMLTFALLLAPDQTSAAIPGVTCPTHDTDVRNDAWLMEIYDNTGLQGEPVERTHFLIGAETPDFWWYWAGDYGTGYSSPSRCVGPNDYSIRFKRYATFQAGNYAFQYVSNDGMRAWVAGDEIIDDQAFPTDQPKTVIRYISAGEHLVEIAYFQNAGDARIGLGWEPAEPGAPGVPVPPAGLRATPGVEGIALTWDVVPEAQRYHIKRSTVDGCCWSEIGESDVGEYLDRTAVPGTTYYYVVSASNGQGHGADSTQVQATAGLPAEGISIKIRGPNGLIASGSSLTLNEDGWPTPNPLDVTVSLTCPPDRPEGCADALTMRIDSVGDLARVHGTSDKCAFTPANAADPQYPYVQWVCDGALAAGESRSFTFTMVVQPSEAATFDMTATWGTSMSARSNLGIPLAQIHPVIVLPGILGTMPPWLNTGAFDPVLRVYEPMMKQLISMGYEENRTVFRMPYDWRRSNRITARFLRDRIQQAIDVSREVPWINPDGKVDLMVHSMGGLVTRSYVQGFGLEADGRAVTYENDIRKVLFVATPHRGFPVTYKTYESGSWWDYLFDTPLPRISMDGVFWPLFTLKHWRETHPFDLPPLDCNEVGSPTDCVVNYYAMTHLQSAPGFVPVEGIESLREMLPTDDSDQFFGPYLCGAYSGDTCTDPYPFGRPRNPLLEDLNAGVGVLQTRLGAENIYVLYGSEPSTARHTDRAYEVDAPPANVILGVAGWRNGSASETKKTALGDDLIPEYSLNLKELLPGIPPANVKRLVGDAARHKQIMYNPQVQTTYVPAILAGLGPLPFSQPYDKPVFLDPSMWGVLAGLCPVNLTITDSQGRRLGYNPATGGTFNEIPGMYASANSENQIIIMKDPPAGNYTVTVNAFGSGPFSLHYHQVTQAGSPRRWAVEGTVNAGDTFEYTLTIDPELPVTQQPPVANAGPDQTVSAGDACNVSTQLDGSASFDPDGEALNYLWGGPFGSASGVRPTVTLPVGTHQIRLVALDGQGAGSSDTVQVTVTSNAAELKSVKVQPEVLEPADNSMRDVEVLIDATQACGAKPACRIKKIETDEGDKRDWQIVGALKAKLRAERSAHGDGRTYKLKIECHVPGAKQIDKTVYVKVRPPGRMKGKGEVKGNGRMHEFEFDVSESKGGKDSGQIKVDARKLKVDRDDKRPRTEKFRSTKLHSVTFRNDEDYKPGGGLKVDSVAVNGEGEFNGKSGYTFEMRANDMGEPGEDRDYLKLIVRDAAGNVVMSIEEKIDEGNIQSTEPPKK